MKSSELYLKGVHELRKTSLTTLCAATALAGIISLFGAVKASSSEPTVAEMQWHRRVLIISTPRVDDPDFENQLQLLAQWRGGDDRDVTVVRVECVTVTGSPETAKEQSDRYELATDNFSATLRQRRLRGG